MCFACKQAFIDMVIHAIHPVDSDLCHRDVWKDRFHSYLSKGILDIPLATIAKDDQCELGKWLNSDAIPPAMRNSSEYQRVKDVHAQFHLAAAMAANVVQSGDNKEAEQLIQPDGALSLLSMGLSVALTALDKALAHPLEHRSAHARYGSLQ